MDLLPVEPYPRGGLTSSWKISNEYRPISGIRYMIHDHESRFTGRDYPILHLSLVQPSAMRGTPAPLCAGTQTIVSH